MLEDSVSIKVEAEIGANSFSLEAGKLAEQANGAVLVRYGDTVVLATAVASKEPREGTDFFPLTIDYEERMYAAGKIPGGFIKRESRPSEAAILAMRLTDRPIRPLFPKGYRNDVQVVLTVLSTDQENDPDMLALNGASAALSISDIPFEGPVGAVRVGRIDGQFVTNPTNSQLADSTLDLVVAGTRDAVMMVEAGAKILPEAVMADAIEYGQRELQKSIELQEKLVSMAGKPRRCRSSAPRPSPFPSWGRRWSTRARSSSCSTSRRPRSSPRMATSSTWRRFGSAMARSSIASNRSSIRAGRSSATRCMASATTTWQTRRPQPMRCRA